MVDLIGNINDYEYRKVERQSNKNMYKKLKTFNMSIISLEIRKKQLLIAYRKKI